MKKQDIIKFLKEKMGVVPYISLFEIYSDEDEIPKEIIEILCKEYNPSANFIICSAEGAQYLKDVLDKYNLKDI